MNSSKRNPLLRKNNEEFNKVIGSLGEEIKDQNLENIDGGSTPACVSAATAVSNFTAWVNDKLTAKIKCGSLFTASAECRFNHKKC